MNEWNRIRPVRALLHPVWVLGLFVLVINDHVLKSSDHAGWLTGKMSDFAGLLIVPVLVAALLNVKTKTGLRGAAFLVGSVFAAINLSPTIAQAWDSAASLIYPFTTTVDPTDLVALVSIPLGLWIFGPLMRSSRRQKPMLVLAQYALATAGGLASVATSAPNQPCEDCVCDDCGWEQTMQSQYSVLNMSRELQVVRIRNLRPEIRFDCDAVSQDPALYLKNEAFGPAVRWFVQSGQEVPMQQTPTQNELQTTDDFPNGCTAVLIQTDTLQDSVVFISGSAPTRDFTLEGPTDEGYTPQDQTLVIRGDYDTVGASDMKAWRFRTSCGERADWCDEASLAVAAEIPSGARYVWEAVGEVAFHHPQPRVATSEQVPDRCEVAGPGSSLYWDEALGWASGEVTGVDLGADGCHKISAGLESWWLCAPRAAVERLVPQDSLEKVRLDADLVYEQSAGFTGGYHALDLTISRTKTLEEESVTTTETLRFIKGYTLPGFTYKPVPIEACPPVTDECDQVSIPVDLQMGETRLSPGDATVVGEGTFAKELVLVQAAQLPVINNQCEEGEGQDIQRPNLQINNPTYIEAVVVGQ